MPSPSSLSAARESRNTRTARTTAAPAAPILVAVPPLVEAAEDDTGIPDPSPGFVRAIAVQCFEVLAGDRTVTQLGPLVSAGLARHLTELRSVWSDRRIVFRDNRRKAPRAGRVRIDIPSPGHAEAATVLAVSGRVHAVAMRLEWAHRHWRATDLTIL